MKPRIFTLAEETFILDAYSNGVSASKIQLPVRCDIGLVYRFLRRRGFDIKKGRYECTSKAVRKTLLAKNADLRSVGIYNPRKRVFSPGDKILAIKSFVDDKLSVGSVGNLLDCSGALATRLLRSLGVDTGQDQGSRIRQAVLKGYRAGRQVPTSIGYGTKVTVATPFQGNMVMRSRLEAARADYFNREGVPWFYEVERYALTDGRTYLPDFWVADCTIEQARAVLGVSPTKDSLLTFLAATPHRVEDVKGWWRSDHPSYQKVCAFHGQFQGKFQVVVRTKDGWSCQ